MKSKTCLLYTLTAVAILSWWYVAFFPLHSNKQPPSPLPHSKSSTLDACSIPLSFLNREVLKEALAGNFTLMSQLIATWDIDAQILEVQGISPIQRLPQDLFVKSQILGRELSVPSPKYSIKLLPQTYAAASFLLAIASPEQIVALPAGLRKQVQIYPEALTSQIPLDINRYNSEKLFLAHPDVAFVSSYYSHPSTLQALKSQGIKIHDTSSLATLASIQIALLEIGKAAERSKEAELLNLFIQASVQTIENRFLVWKKMGGVSDMTKILYLNHHDTFYFPSSDTISCELLSRLGIIPQFSSPMPAPIDREKLILMNPECLIISSSNENALKKKLANDPALKNLSALKKGKVYFLDDDVQQTPTQYVVLAYFDLIQALNQALKP